MKRFLIFIFLPLSIISKGQIQKPFVSTELPPVYFLDSVKLSKLPYFDSNKIECINIVKESDSSAKTYGKVYLKSKNPKGFNFITLEQVAKQYIPNKEPYLFMIDDEFIKDLQDVKIDSSYVLRCRVLNTKEVTYLQKLFPLTILNIKTKSKINLDNEKKIYIRGYTDDNCIK